MDTDLKPRMQPKKDAEQEAIAAQLPDQDDPFKPDEEPRRSDVVVSKKSGGAGKKVLLVLLVLVLMGATGGAVYYWQNQQLKEANARIAELNNQVQGLQGQVDELEATNQETAEATSPTQDERVIVAAANACQKEFWPATGKTLAFAVEGSGEDKKKVLYSSDGNFATLTSVCGTSEAPGDTQTFYLKKTDGIWAVVYKGVAAPDAATIKLYGVPTAFN